ncbi:MAG: integrase core domain-containing protein [Planctomycetota bacterium]|jgi:hypothetical protein
MSRKRYTVEQIIHKLRDELLNVEIFDTLFEAKVLVERWCREYTLVPLRSPLGHEPPALEVIESPLYYVGA